eukprot:9493360-Pyramimonas_sp.AAC.1
MGRWPCQSRPPGNPGRSQPQLQRSLSCYGKQGAMSPHFSRDNASAPPTAHRQCCSFYAAR